MRFGRAKKRAEVKLKQAEAEGMLWIVYNAGTEYEFAECGSCGAEIEPMHFRVKPADRPWPIRVTYPGYCGKCLCQAAGIQIAETGEIRMPIKCERRDEHIRAALDQKRTVMKS